MSRREWLLVALRALWYFALLMAVFFLHDFPESQFRYWRM